MQQIRLVILAATIAISAVPALAQSDFATIEFITKFRSNTAGRALTEDAVQDPAKQAQLSQRLQTLSNDTPVIFTGFVSGGSVRFAVDSNALVKRIAGRLEVNTDISAVRISEAAKLSEVRYSGEAEIVARIRPGRASALQLTQWLNDQSKCIGVPLDGEIRGDDLHLWVRWHDISESIITRIQSHEEIDYIERNELLLPTPKRQH